MAVPRIETFEDPYAQERARTIGSAITTAGTALAKAYGPYKEARARTKTKAGAKEEFLNVAADVLAFQNERDPTSPSKSNAPDFRNETKDSKPKKQDMSLEKTMPRTMGQNLDEQAQQSVDIPGETRNIVTPGEPTQSVEPEKKGFQRVKNEEFQEDRESLKENPNPAEGVEYHPDVKAKYRAMAEKIFGKQLDDPDVTSKDIRNYLYGLGKMQMSLKKGRDEFDFAYKRPPLVSLSALEPEQWDKYDNHLKDFREKKFMPMIQQIVRNKIDLSKKEKKQFSKESLVQDIMNDKRLGFSTLQEDKISKAVDNALKGFQSQAQIANQKRAKTQADTANIRAKTADRNDAEKKARIKAKSEEVDWFKLGDKQIKQTQALEARRTKLQAKDEPDAEAIAQMDKDILASSLMAQAYAVSSKKYTDSGKPLGNDKDLATDILKMGNSLRKVKDHDSLREWQTVNASILQDAGLDEDPEILQLESELLAKMGTEESTITTKDKEKVVGENTLPVQGQTIELRSGQQAQIKSETITPVDNFGPWNTKGLKKTVVTIADNLSKADKQEALKNAKIINQNIMVPPDDDVPTEDSVYVRTISPDGTEKMMNEAEFMEYLQGSSEKPTGTPQAQPQAQPQTQPQAQSAEDTTINVSGQNTGGDVLEIDWKNNPDQQIVALAEDPANAGKKIKRPNGTVVSLDKVAEVARKRVGGQ